MGQRNLAEHAVPRSYQPALDGIRAVAVAMVLCFHAGFEWMSGGYFGVSIFFTLSGFLITLLLLDEHGRTGRIALGAFVGRRVKRLLPASLLCLGLVSVVRLAGGFEQVAGLRAELIGAATHVFNWVKLSGDSSYSDVFAGSAVLVSPLEHYWSLAIEEQFYLVWPVLIALLGRRVRHWSVLLPVLFAVAAIGTPLLALVLSADATYWATPMRAGELLAGAALAAVVRRWPVPTWANRASLPAAAVLVALAVWLPTGAGPAYAGLLAPLAVVSALLLWSLQVPGPLRSVLSAQPLVRVGRISYGVYLFHWPIFVFMRQQGWSLTDPLPFVGAIVATVTIAGLSFVLFERPFRAASWPARRTVRGAVAAMVATAATASVLPFSRGVLEADAEVLAAASAVPSDSLAPLRPLTVPAIDSSASPVTTRPDALNGATPEGSSPGPAARPPHLASRVAKALGTNSTKRPAGEPLTPTMVAEPVALDVALGAPLARPVRLLTVGDSTAFYVGQALAEWSLAHRAHATSDLLWCQGCGFVRAGEVTSWDNRSLAARNEQMLDVDLPRLVERVQPDVVALMVTVVDVADRQWSEGEGPLDPLDDRYHERLVASYSDVVRDLLDQNVSRVAIIKPPPAVGFVASDTTFELARWEALHAALDAVAVEFGADVSTIDMAGWAAEAGVVDDTSWRPDGTHLTEDTARELVERWLGPSLIAVAR